MRRSTPSRLTACLLAALLLPGLARAEDSPTLQARSLGAWKKAVAFLARTQAEDGGWSTKRPGSVGITAVVLEALTRAPKSLRDESFTAMEREAAEYIAGYQQKSGAIHDPQAPRNYSTSLAVTALARYDRKRYAPVIEKATKWIEGIQATKEKGFDPEKHHTYGGFGYGSSLRPDLSNTWIALDALVAAGVAKDDPVWDAAKVFIQRCQNSTEVNDQPYAGTDGGAMYLPAESPSGKEKTAEGKTVFKSYGAMTYAMVLSYLWCGFDKDDLPVKLAVAWLKKNYSVEKHPNANKNGQQGLYYYYRVMSKALTAYGEPVFAGHPWGRDLAAAIIERQREDGSWSNPEDRWREGDPALVTGYALTALALAQKAAKQVKAD